MNRYFLNFSLLAIAMIYAATVAAQEIKYKVSLNTPTLQVADPQTFKSLEKTLTDFLNNQRWTDEMVEENERINCNVQLNLAKDENEKDFVFTLNILATRPVFGSNYESVIFQYADEKVLFSYEPGNTLIFSSTAYNDQLTSILAFYSYIILGLDRDSFSDRGGDAFYARAMDIVSLMPTSVTNKDDFGWSINKVSQNITRYSLLENLQSPKLNDFRTGFYEYHRQGLDLASSNIDNCRKNIIGALKLFEKSYDAYVNSLMINLMGNIKARELVEIFKPASRAEKAEVYRILLKLDPAGVQKYSELR